MNSQFYQVNSKSKQVEGPIHETDCSNVKATEIAVHCFVVFSEWRNL